MTDRLNEKTRLAMRLGIAVGAYLKPLKHPSCLYALDAWIDTVIDFQIDSARWRGRTLVVVGPPGRGKSILVGAWRDHVPLLREITDLDNLDDPDCVAYMTLAPCVITCNTLPVDVQASINAASNRFLVLEVR